MGPVYTVDSALPVEGQFRPEGGLSQGTGGLGQQVGVWEGERSLKVERKGRETEMPERRQEGPRSCRGRHEGQVRAPLVEDNSGVSRAWAAVSTVKSTVPPSARKLLADRRPGKVGSL